MLWLASSTRPSPESATSVRARTANAFTVFNNPALPPPATELTNVCRLTLMCPGGDIHPSDLGYATIAGTFWDAFGYERLTH